MILRDVQSTRYISILVVVTNRNELRSSHIQWTTKTTASTTCTEKASETRPKSTYQTKRASFGFAKEHMLAMVRQCLCYTAAYPRVPIAL